MDMPKTDAKPNNSISVTVREPSSIREIEPRHTYMAKVFNDSRHTNQLHSSMIEMSCNRTKRMVSCVLNKCVL